METLIIWSQTWPACVDVFGLVRSSHITSDKLTSTHVHQESSWCQICHHWWHCRINLRCQRCQYHDKYRFSNSRPGAYTLMAKGKTTVTPSLTHWNYCSLELSHRHVQPPMMLYLAAIYRNIVVLRTIDKSRPKCQEHRENDIFLLYDKVQYLAMVICCKSLVIVMVLMNSISFSLDIT